MQNRTRIALFLVLGGLAAPVQAEETLADWINHYDRPEVQQKILSVIFSGQIGPFSAMKKGQRGNAFPKSSQWVQLGSSVIWSTSTTSGTAPYALVTCFLSHEPEAEPINATSYLLTSMVDRPTAISGGYASYERLGKMEFPSLKKTFVVLWNLSVGKGPNQRSASLLELGPRGLARSQAAWMSPRNVKGNFDLGVSPLGSSQEYLVMRVMQPGSSPTYAYHAYRWNGSRFELDDSMFDSRLKALPEETWTRP